MVVELGLMTALVAAVALLTNLPPGKLSVGSAVAAGGQPAAPSGGPARIALEGGNALVVWPGTAGSNALALRLKGGAKTAEALLELPDGSTRTVTLEPDGARRVLGLRRRSPGRHDQRDHRLRIGDARRQAADRQGLRRPRRRPGTRAGRRPGRRPRRSTWPSGAQRTGGGQARITVLAPDGSAPRNVLVLVGGRPALPCLRTAAVCFTTRVPAGATQLPLSIERPDGKVVTARLTAARRGRALRRRDRPADADGDAAEDARW